MVDPVNAENVENLARHALQGRAKGDVVYHLVKLVTCTLNGAKKEKKSNQISRNTSQGPHVFFVFVFFLRARS